MTSIRMEARRRGLRVAAQVAAITGLVAASAAMSRPAVADASDGVSASGDRPAVPSLADRVSDSLKVHSSGGNCGCAPCWGPPAPPAMQAELLELDLESEYALEAAS